MPVKSSAWKRENKWNSKFECKTNTKFNLHRIQIQNGIGIEF